MEAATAPAARGVCDPAISARSRAATPHLAGHARSRRAIEERPATIGEDGLYAGGLSEGDG
jgi:hypothetical protein